MGPLKHLPTALVTVVTNCVYYMTGYLGISLKAVGLKNNNMGAAMVTNLSGFNYINASAPFTPFANNSAIISVNAPVARAVVVDGQVKVANICYLNSRIDHRYLDGSNGSQIQKAFLAVFNNPEEYSRLKKSE